MSASEKDLQVTGRLVIPARELSISFARSGGPGGQNVNKVASKVILRFGVHASEALGDARRKLLLERLGSRLTKNGDLLIHASTHREQGRNEEDARMRLAALLREALQVQKVRKQTRPTKGSKKRRLNAKRQRGERKRERRRDHGE